MKTYIFPYTLDDGSVAVWLVRADSDADAIRGFRGAVGDGPEVTTEFVILPGQCVPMMTTIRREDMWKYEPFHTKEVI